MKQKAIEKVGEVVVQDGEKKQSNINLDKTMAGMTKVQDIVNLKKDFLEFQKRSEYNFKYIGKVLASQKSSIEALNKKAVKIEEI